MISTKYDSEKTDEDADEIVYIFNNKPKPGLWDKWKAFFAMIFDPWVILLLLSTLFLALVLVKQTDILIVSAFTFLVSIFSGLLGGVIAKRWDDFTEEKLIETRGKSANRSLQLLLSTVISMERRVRVYLQRLTDKEYKKQITAEVTKTYFEEIIEESLGLEEKVINSIEDWTDIIPTSEVKTVIKYITELKINYSETLQKLEQVKNTLQETNNYSQANLENLKEQANSLAKELTRIKKEMMEKSIQIGVPTISGSLLTGSADSPLSLRSTPTFPGIDFKLGLDYELPKGITVARSEKKDKE